MHICQRTFPLKALIAIFWDLQPLWPSSLTKPDLLRFRCSSGHVLSKTKSVTPFFFTFLTSLTHYLSLVKFSEKKQCQKIYARTSLKTKQDPKHMLVSCPVVTDRNSTRGGNKKYSEISIFLNLQRENWCGKSKVNDF